jgi:hypothetical protein
LSYPATTTAASDSAESYTDSETTSARASPYNTVTGSGFYTGPCSCG